MVGFGQIHEAPSGIGSAVAAVLNGGEKPLVVGGDCAVLLGALAAAKGRFGRVGLAFVDGHLDFFGGETSLSGEAADMDLAFVTGYGPEGLVDLAGEPPIVEPGDVVVTGHRAETRPRRGPVGRQGGAFRSISASVHPLKSAFGALLTPFSDGFVGAFSAGRASPPAAASGRVW